MSWSQFAAQLPTVTQAAQGIDTAADEADTIVTTSTAPRTRSVSELSARIKTAKGALIVNANDSDYIVAVNNGLRFSVTRLTNGQYRITESTNFLFLFAGAAILGIVLLGRR